MKWAVFSVLFFSFIIIFVSPVKAQTALDPTYCGGEGNDYYVIPGEEICSRAPNACSNGYDELNTTGKMPNPQSCMGDGVDGRAGKGCAGYVPACCYEVARTGDFTKCIGYWERLWCAPVQCDEARSKGASDAQCGDSCQCGHALSEYCGNISPIPLSQRLGTAATPTVTSAVTPTTTPTPTNINTPTPTPTLANTTCAAKKLQGDYNCDGSINETDYVVWKIDFGNGVSNLAEFEYWRRTRY